MLWSKQEEQGKKKSDIVVLVATVRDLESTVTSLSNIVAANSAMLAEMCRAPGVMDEDDVPTENTDNG